jgi:hypothetical protein
VGHTVRTIWLLPSQVTNFTIDSALIKRYFVKSVDYRKLKSSGVKFSSKERKKQCCKMVSLASEVKSAGSYSFTFEQTEATIAVCLPLLIWISDSTFQFPVSYPRLPLGHLHERLCAFHYAGIHGSQSAWVWT